MKNRRFLFANIHKNWELSTYLQFSTNERGITRNSLLLFFYYNKMFVKKSITYIHARIGFKLSEN